ncbi:helix-hairpin-helix domain-containing protein, partial [Natronoarchaeum mannanilyticum]
MDSRDDTNDTEPSANDAEEDLPTEVPEDSVLYNGDEDDENDADDSGDDSGNDSSISRRAALGVLGVGGVAGA